MDGRYGRAFFFFSLSARLQKKYIYIKREWNRCNTVHHHRHRHHHEHRNAKCMSRVESVEWLWIANFRCQMAGNLIEYKFIFFFFIFFCLPLLKCSAERKAEAPIRKNVWNENDKPFFLKMPYRRTGYIFFFFSNEEEMAARFFFSSFRPFLIISPVLFCSVRDFLRSSLTQLHIIGDNIQFFGVRFSIS